MVPMPRSRLREFRPHHVLHRALYTVDRPGADGSTVTWTVEIDAGQEDGHAVLYADGVEVATAEPPGEFPVPGGTIEVATSMYGMQRVHLVLEDGTEERLRPVEGTLEDLRGRLARRHPRVSRAVARTAVVVLAVNLVLAVPAGLELLTGLDGVAERFGTFTNPIDLPTWLDRTTLVAGVLAAVERALTWKRHKVLDAETIWTSV